ncbi:MAG: hypothetical protein JXL84_07810 [Deltaproteobacteria bacterium]|nr:hypothetical protein [Deltaproteobacteria bacterium]
MKMFRDPIVEEIREVREQHAAKFNYDLRKIATDLRNKEKQAARQVVSFPPKPARRRSVA